MITPTKPSTPVLFIIHVYIFKQFIIERNKPRGNTTILGHITQT
jgi:hypothetical protein